MANPDVSDPQLQARLNQIEDSVWSTNHRKGVLKKQADFLAYLEKLLEQGTQEQQDVIGNIFPDAGGAGRKVDFDVLGQHVDVFKRYLATINNKRGKNKGKPALAPVRLATPP